MHAIDTSISIICNSAKSIRALHAKAISANRFGRCGDREKKNYKASISSGFNDIRVTRERPLNGASTSAYYRGLWEPRKNISTLRYDRNLPPTAAS